MAAAGVEPNEISYSTAIKACEKAGEAERAAREAEEAARLQTMDGEPRAPPASGAYACK